MSQDIVLTGRSSSPFTRIARIFALELGVPFTFDVVRDLTSTDVAIYRGNPALKIPTVADERGPLFGTENICREILRRSGAARTSVVMRGDSEERVVANCEELVLHALGNEVTIIMSKVENKTAPTKWMTSLRGSLDYLDANVETMRLALPAERVLSFVEVSLFCLVTHLPFREVLDDMTPWKKLGDFCARFGERESVRSTEYRFDAA